MNTSSELLIKKENNLMKDSLTIVHNFLHGHDSGVYKAIYGRTRKPVLLQVGLPELEGKTPSINQYLDCV